MQKNTTNYNSNIHFWQLVSLGGGLGGSKSSGGVVGKSSVGDSKLIISSSLQRDNLCPCPLMSLYVLLSGIS